MASRLRGLHLDFGLAVAAGGPELSNAEIVEHIERFCQLADNLAATVVYAFVSVNTRCATLSSNQHRIDLWPGGESPESVQPLCDVLALDAFAYQVLGPGHLDRLAWETLPPGAQRLAD